MFGRNDDGSWTLREARSGTVDLRAIGCRLSVDVFSAIRLEYATSRRSAVVRMKSAEHRRAKTS